MQMVAHGELYLLNNQFIIAHKDCNLGELVNINNSLCKRRNQK